MVQRWYLGVDPRYLGVDPRYLGVDPRYLGVDSRYLGVDPTCLGADWLSCFGGGMFNGWSTVCLIDDQRCAVCVV